MSVEEYCDCAECTEGCDCEDCLLCKGDDDGWFAESDYGDGPGA